MRAGNWAVEICIPVFAEAIDVIADLMQLHFGAPPIIRVITNTGVFSGFIITYSTVRFMAMKKRRRKWRRNTPLAEMLFGK